MIEMTTSTKKLLIGISIALVLMILIYPFKKNGEPLPTYNIADKWIVVTTVNHPTEALKKFESLKGWQLLVVADKKTPENWNLGKAIFLSVDQQESLGYSILSHIPYKSYARKNIGYLYAIQHGAKVIYESDDDNIPYDDILVLEETYESNVYSGKSQTLNPYSHFGYPNIWPRGYPLANIDSDKKEVLKFEKKKVCIAVQQGLANKDPDVDAIWRLTQTELIGTVQFDTTKASPISLPPGTICPYNTQNTVQHYSAFWGLLLPISTSFRVCDIWRGYWVQRLLWEIGCQLSFTKPLVYQDRNAHDYFKDFLEEIQLYTQAGDLVKFLLEWRSNHQSFENRIVQLANDLAEKNFWGYSDALLIKAWVNDLNRVGYSFPPITNEHWYKK